MGTVIVILIIVAVFIFTFIDFNSKDDADIVPSVNTDDLYKETKMYEIERWWDGQSEGHMSLEDYKKKYGGSYPLWYSEKRRKEEVQSRDSLLGLSGRRGIEDYVIAPSELVDVFERQFKKAITAPVSAKCTILPYGSSIKSFIPTSKEDFVKQMITEECLCYSCQLAGDQEKLREEK